jgi:hypothetical protein
MRSPLKIRASRHNPFAPSLLRLISAKNSGGLPVANADGNASQISGPNLWTLPTGNHIVARSGRSLHQNSMCTAS